MFFLCLYVTYNNNGLCGHGQLCLLVFVPKGRRNGWHPAVVPRLTIEPVFAIPSYSYDTCTVLEPLQDHGLFKIVAITNSDKCDTSSNTQFVRDQTTPRLFVLNIFPKFENHTSPVLPLGTPSSHAGRTLTPSRRQYKPTAQAGNKSEVKTTKATHT